MIKVRLKIGESDINDTYEKWGLIFLESDTRFESSIKERDKTSYAEEAGEHTDPRTVQGAFDYTVTFLVEGKNNNLYNINAKVAAFNKALYTQKAGSDIRTYNKVTFYDDYKRCKIVGLPEPISEAKEFYRKQDGTVLDCASVEWKIRVSEPALCDFNLTV